MKSEIIVNLSVKLVIIDTTVFYEYMSDNWIICALDEACKSVNFIYHNILYYMLGVIFIKKT